MGTAKNGNKWSGACIGGNVVSGLVKNGVVFYKKLQSVLYKRRIIVGDNLRGKVIFPYFLTPVNDTFIDNRKLNIIVTNSNYDENIYKIQHSVQNEPNLCQDIIASISESEYIYRYVSDNDFSQNNIMIFNDKDYIVSNIDDCPSYRCIYIEDPNIRPLQVGDKIQNGTKIYFVVPDNFYDTENDVFVIFSNGNFSIEFGSTDGTVYTDIQLFEFFGEDIRGNFYNESICVIESDEISTVNTIGCYDLMTGEITPDDGKFSKYILVDTTTLGV